MVLIAILFALGNSGSLVSAQSLYNVEGQEVTREYVESMNSVSDLLNSGRYREALPVVQGLIDKCPRMPSMHWSLAKIYYNQGLYQKAYIEAKMATSLGPGQANFYITLGNASLKTGRKKESIEALKTFLNLAPNSANAVSVREFIKNIESEVVEDSREKIKSPSGTYLAEATVNGVTHWALSDMPIKVYVDKASATPGRLEVIRQAFASWQSRTGDLVRFKFVETAVDSQIELRFSDLREARVETIEGGHTRFRDGVNGRLKAWITIYKSGEGMVLSDSEIRSIALHEIGHALGINGHSTDGGDIMFLSLDRSRTRLSQRDVNTMKALYALKPGLLRK